MLNIPSEVLSRLPALYSQQNVDDPMVQVKFTEPTLGWCWYASEYDPKEGLFYGYVVGNCPEEGMFSLGQLKGIQGIKMDESFSPCRMSTIRV